MGPTERRPARLDLAWHSTEPNTVRVDEFMRWSRKADVEPMMAVNLGSRGAQEALDILEYCNVRGGTYFSDLRRPHLTARARRRPRPGRRRDPGPGTGEVAVFAVNRPVTETLVLSLDTRSLGGLRLVEAQTLSNRTTPGRRRRTTRPPSGRTRTAPPRSTTASSGSSCPPSPGPSSAWGPEPGASSAPGDTCGGLPDSSPRSQPVTSMTAVAIRVTEQHRLDPEIGGPDVCGCHGFPDHGALEHADGVHADDPVVAQSGVVGPQPRRLAGVRAVPYGSSAAFG